ncbi:MAG: Cytochrome c-type biogenesis protein CcmE [Ignavibacteria bacterium]|nr:Cytochrome c-type biogenesis protein CcmE [Ignavibacteria bacterium]
MSKKAKTITGIIIIVAFLLIGVMSFIDSKIEYVNFTEAKERMRTVEVKGHWIKDKESRFDPETNTFTFYMKDDSSNEVKVVLDGAKPNNFDVAEAVVAKGKMKDGYFHAKEVLTKCPSKYEADGKEVMQTKQN